MLVTQALMIASWIAKIAKRVTILPVLLQFARLVPRVITWLLPDRHPVQSAQLENMDPLLVFWNAPFVSQVNIRILWD